MYKQSPSIVLLVRPASFGFNAETAESNSFQKSSKLDQTDAQRTALAEFDQFSEKLKKSGIDVMVAEDSALPVKPDAIFPNNWFSCHEDGTIVLYPMLAENRRLERRSEIIDLIKTKRAIKRTIDLTHYELENRFLEGTGSIVFDHINKVAYACISPRTNLQLFEELCQELKYKAISFHAHNQDGQEIYHTNVMMAIGTGYAVVCLESISNPEERELVSETLNASSLARIEISHNQVNQFCGNVLELNGHQRILAMSKTAYEAFTPEQKKELSAFCDLLPLEVHTIETIGGGSARCMMAEVFAQPKAE